MGPTGNPIDKTWMALLASKLFKSWKKVEVVLLFGIGRLMLADTSELFNCILDGKLWGSVLFLSMLLVLCGGWGSAGKPEHTLI